MKELSLFFSWQGKSFYLPLFAVEEVFYRLPSMPYPLPHPYIAKVSLLEGKILPWIHWQRFWKLPPFSSLYELYLKLPFPHILPLPEKPYLGPSPKGAVNLLVTITSLFEKERQ